jgi:hypothetical protein
VAGVPFVAVALVAVAHEPKLAGLARRLEREQVLPTASSADLAAACWWALAGPAPSDEAVRAERLAASRVLADLRELAFRRAARRRGTGLQPPAAGGARERPGSAGDPFPS